jgi:hypothetical protein
MSFRTSVGLLGAVAVIAACDRTPTAPPDAAAGSAASSLSTHAPERAAMDRLARRMARALGDPGFRSYVKQELDHSAVVEHKVQFQSFLLRSNGRAIADIARLSGSSKREVQDDAAAATSLEMYFPVAAHRVAWTGGSDVLVASAWEDREAPVAYDTRGRRQVLSAEHPPATPVLAVEPAETDFTGTIAIPSPTTCTTCTPPPPTPPPPPSGLFMTYSHFVQDFEGWFKGNPEFEIHILGQAGTSDSLRDYQCAGAGAGWPYTFDQNDLD